MVKITKEYEKRLLNELKRIAKGNVKVADRSNTTKGALFIIKGSEVGLLRIINSYRKSFDKVEYSPKGKYIRFYVKGFKF